MKKVFLVLFASAAFSIGGCKTDSHDNNTVDSTEMRHDVDQAVQSVDSMHSKPDTTVIIVDTPK